ncbi:CYIR protein, partial [Plasmodium cynomolgi strain B]
MKDLSHRDRCTYLNFWIYGEVSKLYTYNDKNLTHITDIANLIRANIKINMHLINYDFNTNYKLMNQTYSQDKFVKYYDLSKYNPCFFNYDCTFSECSEMKHLYEYFKDYETIKEKINCGQGRDDKYFKYTKYISSLYNKHKEYCCSWGAKICPDYFLSCHEYYDPNKLVSAIESDDTPT